MGCLGKPLEAEAGHQTVLAIQRAPSLGTEEEMKAAGELS